MELFKNKYRTDSLRLKGWDYSSFGYYFVTICTKSKELDFGNIQDGRMCLSEIGCIAHQFWKNIPDHFLNVVLDEFVVMPNHVHGIIRIVGDENFNYFGIDTSCRDVINHVSSKKNIPHPMGTGSLGEIIRWYKGCCSFEIRNKLNFLDFAWQPKFHDHIIRNQESLDRIRKYIRYNPTKWETDLYY